MSNPGWKQFERRVAKDLGTRRIPIGADHQLRGLLGDIYSREWFVEVKLCREWRLPEWIRQARRKSEKAGKPWVLVFKKPGKKSMNVCMDYETFLEMVRNGSRTRTDRGCVGESDQACSGPPGGSGEGDATQAVLAFPGPGHWGPGC